MNKIEVTADLELLTVLQKKRLAFMTKYREPPASFIVTPAEYLSIWAALQLSQRFVCHKSHHDGIRIYDVAVLPCKDGIEIPLDLVTRIQWEIENEQKNRKSD